MIRPLRIALLTYATKPRGSVIHCLELADALHALGHYVCIFALDKDGVGFHRATQCQVTLIPALPAPQEIGEVIRQRIQEFVQFFLASSEEFDIYHAQDCIAANALLALRQCGKIPHFARTIHHIDEFTNAYLHDCQERSIREPDLRLCVSQYWQQALKQRYHIQAPRVTNGVNLARFSQLSENSEADAFGDRPSPFCQRYGINGDPFFLTIGGIEPRKNSLRLLQAFAAVLADHPQAQLMIAGGASVFDYADYRAEFFALAHQLGIEVGRSLLLPGVIPDDDLPELYRCADAFVFPSLKEGWGLVVLEAIASGIPVITSNCHPFTEFLCPNQALLVDPQQPEAIAQAMHWVTQPEVATALVQNSRPVCEQYSWERSARMHVYQYTQLLIARSQPPQWPLPLLSS
ncbi:MSMEG_0565 family glycosyltransferase [Leptolyngbya sp. AN02str]|uniref:MSMEG_0565 family glycosyltransferase n=1 Tax=Leptolyngbya sp. AN02str TaxID=3423363 RepID=UPI003D3171FE